MFRLRYSNAIFLLNFVIVTAGLGENQALALGLFIKSLFWPGPFGLVLSLLDLHGPFSPAFARVLILCLP